MIELIHLVFGEGTDLEIWQMSIRGAVVFVVALVLIRASGRRSFGQHSPFDACITVLLGAVLSRAVVGASPFWATVAAAAVSVAHPLCPPERHDCVRDLAGTGAGPTGVRAAAAR